MCILYISDKCLSCFLIYLLMINTCFVIIFMYRVLVKFMVYNKLLKGILIDSIQFKKKIQFNLSSLALNLNFV